MFIEMKNLRIAIFFIFCTFACLAMSSTVLESSIAAAKTKHEQWMNDFKRTYANDTEKEKRFMIFAEKLEYIERFNRDGNETYKLGLNQFSDLTDEEFVSSYSCATLENELLESSIFNTSEILTTDSPKVPPKRGTPPSIPSRPPKRGTPPSIPSRPPKRGTPPGMPPRGRTPPSIPDEVDWRLKGMVTTVKNQNKPKYCGSCWAFATTAAVEGIMKIKYHGELNAMSAQELVDCVQANSGCRGGKLSNAIKYIAKNGISSDAEYPYRAEKFPCNRENKQSVANIKGFGKVKPGEHNLLEAVARQPVAVYIDVNKRDFRDYTGGIYRTGPCGPKEELKFDHAVAVIGYGKEGQDEFWLIKNSYGDAWGEKGYMKLKREGASPYPVCGITMKASYYPTVE